jgi:hypothetical protein
MERIWNASPSLEHSELCDRAAGDPVSESGQQPRSFKDDGDKALAAMLVLFSLVHASIVFWLVPTSPLPIQG